LPPFAFFQYCRGYWMDIDMAPYERVLAAARSASSARDSTLIQTRTRGTLTAGPGIKCGEIVCGQIGPI
jgi:hypothetical protein